MIVDVWRTHQYYGVLILLLLIPLAFAKRIGVTASLLWAWLLFCSYKQAMLPGLPVPSFLGKLALSSTQSLLAVLLIPVFALSLRKDLVSYALAAISFLLVGNGVYSLIFGYGIFNAGTFDLGVMALALPYFTNRMLPNNGFWAFPFFALIGLVAMFGGSETCTYVTAISLIAYVVSLDNKLWVLPLAVPFGAIAWLVRGKELVSTNGRWLAWSSYIHWWQEDSKLTGLYLQGQGLGSFEVLSKYIESGSSQRLLWMHNDYLQILFEAGYVGLVLTMLLFVSLLFDSIRKPFLFASLLGAATLAFVYSPMHFALTQLYVVLLIVAIKDGGK